MLSKRRLKYRKERHLIMETRKRLPELSYLNLTFCILVILIHVLSEPVGTLDKSSLQYFAVMIPFRLSAFVVQGFIFLSGLKLCLGGRDKIYAPALWCRRLKSVVVPYLIWVLLYYCYFVGIGYFPFSFKELFRYAVVGDLVAPFYFIITIVQFYLLAPIFVKLTSGKHTKLFLVLSLVINLIFWIYLPTLLRVTGICENFRYNDRVFTTYLIYFAAGCIAGQKYDKLCAVIRRVSALMFTAFPLIAAGDIILYCNAAKVGGTVCEIYHMVYSLAAILFFTALYLKLTDKRKSMPKILSSADKATFPVYLCHCLFIFILNSEFNKYGINDIGIRLVLRFVIVYIVSFGGAILWQWVKNKIDSTAKLKY